MTNITRNILTSELICPCGECDFAVDSREPVIQHVQEVADHFNALYIIIKSAARCINYNRTVPSPDNSRHAKGDALDFSLIFPNGDVVPPLNVAEYLNEKHPISGIGVYTWGVHYDTRPWQARW